MEEKDILERMNLYTEITKVTTIYMDSNNIANPLISKGLTISSVTEYADFDEIVNFMEMECKKARDSSLEQNTFHTLHTKNFFVYNIVFIPTENKVTRALVAGPILAFQPNKKFINEILANNGLPLVKKYEFMGILNNLPLATKERISQLGKLLLLLVRVVKEGGDSSIQEFHGNRNSEEELQLEHLKDSISSGNENNEVKDFYKFCANLMDKIIHGNVNGIVDIIGEYKYLFWDIKSVDYNERLLKNKCIIICSAACHFAIQANVPYERMFSNLWKSILKLEKLTTTAEVILHMATTIEGFAHAVYVLTDNNYSLHINQILQYIKSHFTEKITLKQLSEFIKVNPVYLSSLIKKETSRSLSDHINFIRIEESKRLLVYTVKSIHEIAYEVGYNYQNHFNTVFKKLEGITPLEYRNNNGSLNHIV